MNLWIICSFTVWPAIFSSPFGRRVYGSIRWPCWPRSHGPSAGRAPVSSCWPVRWGCGWMWRMVSKRGGMFLALVKSWHWLVCEGFFKICLALLDERHESWRCQAVAESDHIQVGDTFLSWGAPLINYNLVASQKYQKIMEVGNTILIEHRFPLCFSDMLLKCFFPPFKMNCHCSAVCTGVERWTRRRSRMLAGSLVLKWDRCCNNSIHKDFSYHGDESHC